MDYLDVTPRLRKVATDAAVEALAAVVDRCRPFALPILDNNTVEVTVTVHNKAGNPIKVTVKREVE